MIVLVACTTNSRSSCVDPRLTIVVFRSRAIRAIGRVPSPGSGLRKSLAVGLARAVELRLLEFFRQLSFVQLLQVPDDALILRKGISLAIRQKGNQLVALFCRKLIE